MTSLSPSHHLISVTQRRRRHQWHIHLRILEPPRNGQHDIRRRRARRHRQHRTSQFCPERRPLQQTARTPKQRTTPAWLLGRSQIALRPVNLQRRLELCQLTRGLPNATLFTLLARFGAAPTPDDIELPPAYEPTTPGPSKKDELASILALCSASRIIVYIVSSARALPPPPRFTFLSLHAWRDRVSTPSNTSTTEEAPPAAGGSWRQLIQVSSLHERRTIFGIVSSSKLHSIHYSCFFYLCNRRPPSTYVSLRSSHSISLWADALELGPCNAS